MEYANAVAELEARGFTFIMPDENSISKITDRWGESLENPTDSDLVRLSTGMTISQLRAEHGES
jgi:hypothetical protein